MMRMLFTTMLAVFAVTAASAEERLHSPYSGFQQRPIKALSAQQVAGLKAGRGMGLALAAELNGYPGPIHVLELADKLELTATQRDQMEALLAAMKSEAVPLGERLIPQEAELDRHFSSRTIMPVLLASGTEAIGLTQAALRTAHLKYHLATVGILTPGQTQRYAELRGYAAADRHPGHH